MGEKVQCFLFHAPPGRLRAGDRRRSTQESTRRMAAGLRIAKNRHVGAAKIAAKEHGGGIAACRVFHPNGRRSQDMAGVVKGRGHAWSDLEQIPIPCALKSSNELTDIIGIVEWLDTGLSLSAAPAY